VTPWNSARLSERYEAARERLLAARLGRGEDVVLVPEAEALIARNPLREERWRLLTLAGAVTYVVQKIFDAPVSPGPRDQLGHEKRKMPSKGIGSVILAA
jgi:hypothetical protein